MSWQDEQDDVVVTTAFLPKKDVQCRIEAAEGTEWKVKPFEKGGAPGHEGESYKAMKLTVTVLDETLPTELENAQPRRTLEVQLNLDRYPVRDKKTGTVRWMGRQLLQDLEEALGFDPIFQTPEGTPVEPHLTHTGRKVAPKQQNVKRVLNPAFTQAYFHPEGSPNLEWAGKIVYADIELEKNEQYGDKNVIKRFKPTPVHI